MYKINDMRIVLIFIFLLLSFVGNSQIQEFIESYKDTSKIYSNWISIIPDAGNNIPEGGFYFQVKTKIKANSTLAYSITDSRYEEILNKTRESSGKDKLLKNPELDKIAEERAIRMANILIGEDGEIRKEIKGRENIIEKFYEESHSEANNKENAAIELCTMGEAGLFSYPIGNYCSPEASLATFYTSYEKNKKRGFKEFTEFNVNNDLNNSRGHYLNRTSEYHTQFGYCILVIEYKNGSKRGRMVITYEVFDSPHNLQ